MQQRLQIAQAVLNHSVRRYALVQEQGIKHAHILLSWFDNGVAIHSHLFGNEPSRQSTAQA